MTTQIKTTMDYTNTESIKMQDHRLRSSVLKVGRFILHFLEMSLAMMVGMPILSMVHNLVPATSSFAAAFKPGTNLYGVTMAFFMTVPMVAWMIIRGHGWRHSAEMAFAMLAPVAVVIVLNLLGVAAYLPWLGNASHLAMPLGMIIAMLYRRDHYTGENNHKAHSAHATH